MRKNLFRRYNRAHAALARYARTRGSARVIPSARRFGLGAAVEACIMDPSGRRPRWAGSSGSHF